MNPKIRISLLSLVSIAVDSQHNIQAAENPPADSPVHHSDGSFEEKIQIKLATNISVVASAGGQAISPKTRQVLSGSFYENPRSSSTTRDPDPPKYAGNFSQSWLSRVGGIYKPERLSWLDIGLDTRVRYEYRDNDLRGVNEAQWVSGGKAVYGPRTALSYSNPKKVFNQTENVFLQRTRLYLGVKDIIDPFRFAVEIADSRRYGRNRASTATEAGL